MTRINLAVLTGVAIVVNMTSFDVVVSPTLFVEITR